MKKKTIVISIIVVQFVVIVLLWVFSLLKMVETNNYREMVEEAQDRAIKAREREILLIQQTISYSQELEKCQGKK